MPIKPTMGFAPGARWPQIPHYVATGPQAVLAKVQLAMETQRGTWPQDEQWGLPIPRWLARPATADVEIQGTVRRMLLQIPGVVSVDRVEITRGATMQIDVGITIRSDDEVVSAEVAAVQATMDDPRLITIAALTPPLQRLRPGMPTALLPGSAPPPELPADAWGIWDPVLSPGTIGATYSDLPDQSGNGRDWTEDPTCAVTADQYLANNATGRQYLPKPDVFNTLNYRHTSSFSVGHFALFGWGHHNFVLGNTAGLGICLYTSSGGSAFKIRWKSDNTIRLAGTGTTNEVTDTPIVSFPGRGGAGGSGSLDAWYAWGVSRKVTGNTSRWTWVMVADLDDGLGVQLITSSSWYESTTATQTGPGQFQANLNAVREVTAQEGGTSGKETGGGAFYTRAVSDNEVKRGVAWAARRFSGSAYSATRALLGV